MDKAQLIEATACRAAEHSQGRRVDVEDVDRILDVLFGTVEHPGTIAEALRAEETVTLGSFSSFNAADGTAVFRAGKALTAYLDHEAG